MLNWINSNSSLVVILLTFVLAVATLQYVRLTKQIAEASRLQAESLHKPVLTFMRNDNIPPLMEELMERRLTGEEARIEAASPLRIVNIGSGPALQINWSTSSAIPPGAPITKTEGFMPYVQAGDSFSIFEVTSVKMGGFQFHIELECRYESLSGTKYVSKTVVDKKKVVGFQVRSA